MDIPPQPQDLDVRNIIDKLAQFVARNGPEFEQMTKSKQSNNPKFNFLFGGEYYGYYQYRVSVEESALKEREYGDGKACLGPMPSGHSMPSSSHYSTIAPIGKPPVPPGPPFMPPHLIPPSSGAPFPAPSPQVASVMVNTFHNNNNSSASQPHQYPSTHPSFPVSNLSHSNSFGYWRPPYSHELSSASTTDNENSSIENSQITLLQEQVKESEKNLKAQYQVIMEDEEQQRIEESIAKSLDDELKRMCEDYSINLNKFDKILQPIIETCRKESIANGKVWIFNNCHTEEQYDAVAKHLLKRITRVDTNFEAKLHLMYLINDIFNHCMRKGDEQLKNAIAGIIVPVFSSTIMDADEEKKQKMNKLLKLWEMNQYLNNTLLDQLKTPEESLDSYKTSLYSRFSEQIKIIHKEQLDKYEQLQNQHEEFVKHCEEKIKNLQKQTKPVPHSISGSEFGSMPITPNIFASQAATPGITPSIPFSAAASAYVSSPASGPIVGPSGPPHFSPYGKPPLLPNSFLPEPPSGFAPIPPLTPYNQPLIPLPPATALTPSQAQSLQEEVKPPYFDLPAGIMTQLIKLEDFDYNSINPEDIRMPVLTPPSERLLQSLEAFYAPPSHEHPRNAEGWEKLGLYEFFKAKSQARKDYDGKSNSSTDNEFQENSLKHNSKSPDDKSGSNLKKNANQNDRFSPPKRRYKEFKEERSRQSRSRSRSPVQRHRRRRSPSRSRSRSNSPTSRSLNSKLLSSRRSRSKSPLYSKAYEVTDLDSRLSESNKGHQMLKKMGWSGSTGLGTKEQGLLEPLPVGQARDKMEQYRGIGLPSSSSSTDPYESFRRNKGQAYIQRIRDGRQ